MQKEFLVYSIFMERREEKGGRIFRKLPPPIEGADPRVLELVGSGDKKTEKLPRTREQIKNDISALIDFFSHRVERLRIVLEQENNREQRLAVLAQIESDTQHLRNLWKEFLDLRPPREL
ncbi:MAG: hypothetical protein AAB945_00790 [Patescibacteria group bacterium]